MISEAKALTRPPLLRPGARLAVISPASTPKRELVELGMLALAELGYQLVLGPHALTSGPLYFAGTLEQRLEDFHAAFQDPSIDGILCTRGGWGSAELLPHLNRTLVCANPKPFLGYSDHTSLHIWLQQTAGLVTFYAPMVASDFSRSQGVHQESWVSSLVTQQSWSLGKAEGLRVLRSGEASGLLHGGCLSIYAESLGTPFAALPRRGILFLEDVGTKPYQWDRMLVHLRLAGILDHVEGIVFGDMHQCVAPEEQSLLEQSILHALHNFPGPIGIGLQSGHVNAPNITLTLGSEVHLDLRDASAPSLRFPQAGAST